MSQRGKNVVNASSGKTTRLAPRAAASSRSFSIRPSVCSRGSAFCVGPIWAAADELALSQPAISNALKAMETQAGFALFERINNRLFPTTEAMALYKESEAIFALHAKLENRVRDLRECRSGLLSIVATPPLAYSIIPPALSGFLRRRAQTRVFFDVRRYEGIIDGVTSRVAELGFALGLSHHPGIAHEVVHTGEMVCVLPLRHPLAERPVISASDLAGSPFIGLERGTRLGEAV